MLCTQFYCNSPRVGLDSHFSGESVSFRDYTLPVKIDMSAPGDGAYFETGNSRIKRGYGRTDGWRTDGRTDG